MSVQFENLASYLLVFVRLTACIMFNPVFSRKNIPQMARLAFIVWLSLMIAPNVSNLDLNTMDDLSFILLIFKEVLLGYFLGYVVQLYQFMLFFVGDLLDYQFGLSMAKVFDPQTHVQVSAIGNLFQILFVVLFFMSDSHLLFIRMIASSFDYLAIDAWFNISKVIPLILDLFIQVFMLVIKLALPMIVAAFTLEIAMGILMKLIPQIHVFVINIQLKVLLGITLLLIMVNPITHILDKSIGQMMLDMQNVLMNLF
jgi:flagellar biosynthesis protein FliR